jgi:glyoxylase-like metal-dependent hydrolase (beta-lactamase superfamily II)
MPLPGTGQRAVNIYAIESDDGLVMVDSGWSPLEQSRPLLTSALAATGHRLVDITQFLVTHVHRDHYTFAVEHRREFGSRILLGAGEASTLATLRAETQQPYSFELALLRRCGLDPDTVAIPWTPVEAACWEEPDEWLASGTEIGAGARRLAVIATPGHTRGHVVFHDTEHRQLFAGDHVLPNTVPAVGIEPQPSASAMSDYLSSLRLMLTLPDCTLLPAHGGIGSRLHQRSLELLEHQALRLRQCLSHVGEQPVAAVDVARRMRWTRAQIRYGGLSARDQTRAVFKVIMQLDHAVAVGSLDQVERDGVALFRAMTNSPAAQAIDATGA